MTKPSEVVAVISIDQAQISELAMEAIRAEIRTILSTQLDNIVVGEMAKMKLFKPGTSDLQTMITNKVDRSVARAMNQDTMVSTIRGRIYQRVDRIVGEEAQKQGKSLVATIKSRMATSIQSALKDNS